MLESNENINELEKNEFQYSWVFGSHFLIVINRLLSIIVENFIQHYGHPYGYTYMHLSENNRALYLC